MGRRPLFRYELRFENVDLEYERGIRVIQKNFEIAVRRGELIALDGRSGAGKTTITDLVARFLDPTSGRIMLNGYDVRDLRLASYRRLTALVQQEVFLFDGLFATTSPMARTRRRMATSKAPHERQTLMTLGFTTRWVNSKCGLVRTKKGEMKRPNFDCTARALCLLEQAGESNCEYLSRLQVLH